jgi:hypothetical protein
MTRKLRTSKSAETICFKLEWVVTVELTRRELYNPRQKYKLVFTGKSLVFEVFLSDRSPQ